MPDRVTQAGGGEVGGAEVTGEQHRPQIVDERRDRVARRQEVAVAGAQPRAQQAAVRVAQRLDHRGERVGSGGAAGFGTSHACLIS